MTHRKHTREAPASAPDPWLRRPGEGSLAHRAFVDYLFMGPERSLAKLARQQKRGQSDRPDAGLTQLKKWSTRWDWHDRVTAYDDEQARLDLAEHDMGKLVARVANHLVSLGLERLARADVDELTQTEAVKMVSEGMRLERKVRTLEQPAKKTR